MYDENNNGTQNQEEPVTDTSGQTDSQTDTRNTEENHEYRYGRSYYENQQDSVYHTNENPQQNNTYSYSQQQENTYQHSQQQNGQNSNPQYQTYATGNYTNTASGTGTYGSSVNENNSSKKTKNRSGKKTGRKIVKAAACVVLMVAVGGGTAFGTVKLMDRNEKKDTTVQTTVASTKNTTATYSPSVLSSSTTVLTEVSDVVEQTMPSVVKITNIGTQTYQSFFGQSGTYESESNGSGIIIGQTEEELLVVTNQHVVSGADKLTVIFIDEESCEANVKGTDSEKDLAVIAIPISSIKEDTLSQIKVATLGDSDNLKVGEPAIAIGNALGYGQSVTVGVISAKDREVTTENSTNKLIQTDAAINPGNSGGALLNIAGEVIGINSVKYSSTEVEGMGYAIPISDASPIINELMNKETKTKVDEDQQSYLGISGVDITSDVAQTYNMPKGVYVAQVVEDSPAEEAGLKKGDIITKIADVSVTSFDELKAELEYHAAGTTVQVEILTQAKGSYGYETKTIDVTLAKKED